MPNKVQASKRIVSGQDIKQQIEYRTARRVPNSQEVAEKPGQRPSSQESVEQPGGHRVAAGGRWMAREALTTGMMLIVYEGAEWIGGHRVARRALNCQKGAIW